MRYDTVFDVARDGFTEWKFPAFGLIFVVVGVGMLVNQHRHPDPRRGRWKRTFPVFYTTFAVLWTLVAFMGTYSDYARLRDALRAGNYVVAEGVVTNFKPAPREGHADEEFDVDGHHYAFSDYVVIAGYHRSRSHGGAIREGLRVRIADVAGKIARLEVAADRDQRPPP
jgi:hypothetical protein